MARYDDDDDFDDYDIRRTRGSRRDAGSLPQSGLGLSSIGIAAVMFVSLLFLIAVAAITADNNNPPNDKDPVAIIGGLGIIACVFLTLIGLILGVIACCQPDRSMLCGLFGAILNGLILFGVLVLICAGLAIGG